MGDHRLWDEMVDPPEDFVETFHGSDISTRNTYNMARFAARDVVRLFQEKLFDWLERHWCDGCPYKNDGK